MLGRFKYAGAVGLLLTLACGPQVEIGHGTGGSNSGGAGSSNGGVGATGAAPSDGGAFDDGGTTGAGASAGSSMAGRGGNTGGPIPLDNGPQAEVGKVDLLLAVDNSRSMAEKQKLFAKAVPELVKRLVNPRCVDNTGKVAAEPASPDLACPAGSKREFDAVRDLHVGVITSSLGSHGAPSAKDVCATTDDNDHAHLIPSVRPNVPSYNGTGYLKWDPDGKANPPGASDPEAFAASLATTITAAGEHGCGFEAQLESVYRFLVDPEPPLTVALQGNLARMDGIDDALLAQRAEFLRPDSSVVVLMLTDENDCSIRDDGYGWLVSRTQSMYRSTSVCATDPASPCCQSCAEQTANVGCPAIQSDMECQKGITLAMADDDLNLRCWQQKRRFGFDLLYPIERYVGGFGAALVPNRAGQLVENPLFNSGSGKARDRSLFTLAVIGGVPWQDLATPASLKGGTLEYMTAEQLGAAKRWQVILGDPASFTEPSDPFMHESVDERSGKNPVTGESIVPGSSTDPRANTINGHEQKLPAGFDLQYACTFPLPDPIVCDQAASDADIGCDCFSEDLPIGRSVCNPPAGGPATTTQYYGKAYPALRELAVAQQLGRRSVLGSICAVNTQDDTQPDYGYRPVFNAIGRRVAATLLKP